MLHFENKLDKKPNQRIALFIDVAAMRAQASRSFNSNQFNIDYSYIIKEIAASLGSVNLVEMFITITRYDRKDSADSFIKHAQSLGVHVHMCTAFRNERINKNDPHASEKLAEYAGQIIQVGEDGWTIIGGAKPKITTKTDMAAAIVAAATSGRFDCIVLGTTDSIFSNIIERYILPIGMNCGIVFIQQEEHPEFIDRTINSEFLNLFNFRLRFDNEGCIKHNESSDATNS